MSARSSGRLPEVDPRGSLWRWSEHERGAAQRSSESAPVGTARARRASSDQKAHSKDRPPGFRLSDSKKRPKPNIFCRRARESLIPPRRTHRRARSRFRSAVTRPARVFRDSTGCTHSPLAAFHARQPLFVRTGRRRADLDNHNGPPHAQKRSQLQQRRRPVSQEGETRVVRGPEQGRSGVEHQATRPGQRYAVERARKRAPGETSTRLVAPIERDAAPFFSSTSRIAAPT